MTRNEIVECLIDFCKEAPQDLEKISSILWEIYPEKMKEIEKDIENSVTL